MSDHWDEPDPPPEFDVGVRDEEDGDEDLELRRPLWIPVVAAIVVLGMIWAAVPTFLWPWIVFTAFVGFLLWRAIAPRRP